MEQHSDPFALYQELLFTSFDKIQKVLPKKYKQIKELIVKSTEQIKSENASTMNANKYFIIYKFCMETKNNKLIEISLYYIQKLISHGFMDCNCKDYTFNLHIEEYVNPNKEAEKQPDKNRKLIDAVVEAICFTQYEKDEAIQLQVLKALLTIVTSSRVEVHDKSLLLVFKTFYAINITSKNTVNQTTARAALNQMISVVYQRMEEHNMGKEEWQNFQKHSAQSNNNSMVIHPSETETSRIEKGSHQTEQSTVQNNEEQTINTEVNRSVNDSALGSDSKRSASTKAGGIVLSKSLESQESKPAQGDSKMLSLLIEGYVSKAVQNLVDDVVLYDAKIQKLKENAQKDPNKDPSKLEEELNMLQIKSVPLTINSEDSKFLRSIDAKAENEKGIKSGLFGWCFHCRNPAELYCKDTRVPICSVECKMKHLDEIDEIQALQTGAPVESKRVNIYLHDGVQLFKLIAKMSTKDDLQQYGLKSKILILELLRGLLENPGPTFLARKEFAEVAKDYLCESILKNSVSADRPVVILNLGIFVCLVNHFRHHLKQEIAVFINSIFLKMLESGNSTYYHRLLALQVINKISQRAINMIEFYVNYDCDVHQMNIVERMVEFLGKIAQGKYSKTEYNTIIQPTQEYTLKTLALDSIVSLCKSLAKFTEDIENQNKIGKSPTSVKPNQTAANGNDNPDDDVSSDEETKDENMGMIEKSKMKKNEIQRAIFKFNIKPKAGLKYIYTLGHLKEDPKEVAQFLMKYHDNLSKETLGDYFGEEAQFNISVLEAFTDLISFKKTTIDEGMKHFLTFFDLPGEGQKVDRIVQVFARKYIHDNPTTVYKSSTAAYTLSYLLMMLQTSLHNPQVTEKMTLQQFVDLARGINDGENLPVEELNGLYARVQKCPLAIPSSEKAKQNLLASAQASLKKKQDLFMKESENMIQQSKELIKKGHDSQFIRVQSTEYIRPLFSIMWSPLLAGFSVLLEQNDDPKIIQLCLEGYSLSIYLAGRYGLDDERDTFVMSLYNFTGLKKGFNPMHKDIKEKHLQATKTLLQIATNPNNFLKSSWGSIIECLSRIDYFVNLNISSKRDSRELDPQESHELMIGNLLRSAIDPNLIELVFSKSSLFVVDEIIAFISNLCAISEQELKGANPRTYCLQKMVEVAEYNMDRVKFVWQKIWNLMKDHFGKVGCHQDSSVGMFAVDSLKQLAAKFLRRDELSSFDFQKEFLKPFETIFASLSNDKLEIKILILSCIDHIISHSKDRIRSGWKTIFDVLGYSADSDNPEVVEMAFHIIEKHFSSDLSPLKESLLEYLHVLLKFMNCRMEKISFNSVALIQQGMSFIVKAQGDKKEDKETPKVELVSPLKSKPADAEEGAEEKEVTSYYGLTEDSWLSLLGKLATMATDSRPKIANTSLQTLYTILKENGSVFTHDFWQMIISGVIKLLFDELQFSFQSKKYSSKDQSYEFLKQNCKQAYSKMIDIYKLHHSKLKDFMPEFLSIIVNPMQNPHESLAKISIEAFKSFVANVSPYFDENAWNRVIESLEKVIQATTPSLLIEAMNSEALKAASQEKKLVPLKWNFDETVTKCVVQLLMITVMKDLIDEHYDKLKEEHINQMRSILQNSYDFARSFNEQLFIRYSLWKNGFMKDMNHLPGLLKQEKEALATQTLLLYQQCMSAQEEEKKKEFLDKFLDNALGIMKAYSSKYDDLVLLLQEEAANKGNHKKPEESENLDQTLKRLKSHELEREIVNVKSTLSTVIVPKLIEIDVQSLKGRSKEIVEQLININGNSLSILSHHLKEESSTLDKNEVLPEEIDRMIKKLLLKFFDVMQAS